MATEILQSTARNEPVLMVLSSDSKTGATGKTLSVSISKNGGSFNSISPTVTELANGWYNVAFTTSHTDTLGKLAFHITATDCDPSDGALEVIATKPADVLKIGGTAVALTGGLLNVNVQSMTDETITDSVLAASAITAIQSGLATSDALALVSTAITNLNNLSAKCNLFGPGLLEIPDSGSTSYRFEMVVRDDEDKLVNLDASPTIGLLTHAGASRSSYVGTVSNPSTGVYRFTITIASTDPKEGLMLTAVGATSGEERTAKLGLAVVDYDAQTLIAAINAKLGTPSTTIAGDIAAVPAAVRSELTSELTVITRYGGMIELDGVVYRFTANALEQGPSGGAGGTFNYTVQVSPGINSGATNCDATDRTKYNLEARKSDTKTFIIPVYESDGVTPYDFTGMTLRVVVEPKASATDRQVIENADITVSDNIVSFTTTTANTISGKAETLKWALQRVTTSPAGKEDILFGDYYVREGCAKD